MNKKYYQVALNTGSTSMFERDVCQLIHVTKEITYLKRNV